MIRQTKNASNSFFFKFLTAFFKIPIFGMHNSAYVALDN